MKAKLLSSTELEQKVSKAFDKGRVFDLDDNPEAVFAAMLIVGFRRVLAVGGSPHAVAAAFYDVLADVFEGRDKNKTPMPRLTLPPKGSC